MELTRRDPGPLVALGALLGPVLLGAPVGLAWAALAPRPAVVASARGLDLTDTETKAFIAADGVLFLLCLAAGLLVGALAWRAARRSGVVVVVGVVVGSAVAAWVAHRVGTLGQDRGALIAAAQAGRVSGPTSLPLQLRAETALLAWPGGAALALAVLAFGGGRRRRARDRSG